MAAPYVGDSRKPRGPGILPLQHYGWRDRGIPLRNRTCLLALRIVDRRIGEGELGHYEADEETVGDVTGGHIWPKTERELPPWRFSPFPVATVGSGAGGGSGGSGGAGSGGGGGGSPGGPTSPRGDVPANTRNPGGGGTGAVPGASGASGAGIASSGGGNATGASVGGGAAPSTAGGSTSGAVDHSVQPIRDRKGTVDDRLLIRKVGPDTPDPRAVGVPMAPRPGGGQRRRFPSIPSGSVGIVATGTDDEAQEDVFLPTDPRLVAAHRGPGGYGSWVVDITAQGGIDLDRTAPLQSALRVVKGLGGGILSLAGPRVNALSWTLTTSGQRDVLGGLVHDGSTLARVSVADGGAIDCGSGLDKHVLGRDADGVPCNPSHVPTLAFYRGVGWPYDGPLEFQERKYPNPPDLPFKSKVHLTWDQAKLYFWPQFSPTQVDSGMWRWYAEYTYGVTTPGNKVPVTTTPETKEPKDPPPPPEGEPPTTPGGGDPGGPIDRPDRGPTPMSFGGSVSREERPTHFTNLETAFPSTVGFAMRVGMREPMWPWAPSDPNAEARVYESPATIRTQAFGAQGGYRGLTDASPANSTGWTYTQRPTESTFPGGTAVGGWIDLPPEVSLEDVVYDFAPPGVTVSSAMRVLGPGVSLAFGVPDLSTGGMRDGWTVARSNSNLVIGVTASGTSAVKLTLTSSKATVSDGYNVEVGTTTGTKIATAANEKLGFHGATPTVQQTGYSVANVITSRSYDAAAVSLDTLAAVVGTLIADLKAKGLIAA